MSVRSSVTWATNRRPELPDAERVPPRLPAEGFLLDFLPFERRALRRTGVCAVQGGLQRDRPVATLAGGIISSRSNGSSSMIRVALARVWLLDDVTDDYIAVPYRIPHPDMTLAESQEARRRMRASRAQDRTERWVFENLAEIRAVEEQARSATSRRKAERTRLANKVAREPARQAWRERPG